MLTEAVYADARVVLFRHRAECDLCARVLRLPVLRRADGSIVRIAVIVGTVVVIEGVLSTSNRKPPLRLAPMIQIAKIVADLRAEGHPIEDETLMHVTPLMRKHINPFGRYHFDLGRMRPDLDRSSAASA